MGRAVVKITGTLDEQITIAAGSFTILGAPDARLTSTAAGSIVDVTGSADVTISGLQIGDDVLTPAIGVQTSSDGCRLVLDRVTITGSSVGAITAIGGDITVVRSTVSDNPGGGIRVYPQVTAFSIQNNFILLNGSATTGGGTFIGGADIGPNVGGRLEFNTVAFNESSGARDAGIACFGTLNSAMGNLVYGNREGTDGSTNDTQFGGNCAFGNSIKVASGSVGFRNPPPGGLDFHLTTSSPASLLDAGGDCAARIPVDFDGQARPYGPACDIGADELDP